MQDTEFSFDIESLDGARLIRVRFPRTIVQSAMPEAYSTYLSLLDADMLTVVLVDVSRLEGMPDEARQALHVLFARVGFMSGFCGSAWLRGDNAAVEAEILALFVGIDRQAYFFDAPEKAVEHLRMRVRTRRDATPDS